MDSGEGNVSHNYSLKLTRVELNYIEKLLKGKVDQRAADILIHVQETREWARQWGFK